MSRDSSWAAVIGVVFSLPFETVGGIRHGKTEFKIFPVATSLPFSRYFLEKSHGTFPLAFFCA